MKSSNRTPSQVNSLCLLMLLVANAQCSDWQASGNMTQGNLSTIMMKIDDAIDDNLTKETIALNISDQLNALWDRFWNTLAGVLEDPSKDAVVFGYAFRGHWFWINNYRQRSQSFIIWKDYNCEEPVTYCRVLTDGIGRNNDIIFNISPFPTFARDFVDNPWALAYRSVSQTQEALNSSSLSAVASSGRFAELSVRVCLGGQRSYESSAEGGQEQFIFTTREGFYQYQPITSPAP